MKKLIIVTGASRGIGEAISIEFNNSFDKDAHFLLIARDIDKLFEVRNKIIEESHKRNGNNQVSVLSVDFSKKHEVSDYFKLLKDVFVDTNLNSFGELYVVYNHGSLEFGNVSLIAQQPLREKFETNLFSIWSLLSAINLLLPTNIIKKQFHINISSGYANEPAANWSGHCCSRASRDMLFKCLALEQLDLRILNYEPGIVYTDMLKQACDISEEYQEGYASGKYTKSEDTARKLLSILKENTFLSGGRIKYSK